MVDVRPSTVPAFKRALKALIEGLSVVTDNDLVTIGHPTTKQPAKLIVVGDTSNRVLRYVAGMTQANETYDVEVLVSVVGSVKDDHDTIADRAYVISDAVEEAVRIWTLDGCGGVVNTCLPNPSKDEEAVDGSVREVSVTMQFSVAGRR